MGRRPIRKVAMTPAERQRRRRARQRAEPTLENLLVAMERLEEATWTIAMIMEQRGLDGTAFARLSGRLHGMAVKAQSEMWPTKEEGGC
jgi:hypothetical protein